MYKNEEIKVTLQFLQSLVVVAYHAELSVKIAQLFV